MLRTSTKNNTISTAGLLNFTLNEESMCKSSDKKIESEDNLSAAFCFSALRNVP